MTMIIEATSLVCGYGAEPVLNGISIGIRQGEIWAVLGKNGAGKSTFVKAVAGLIPVNSGFVSIAGKPLHAYSARDLAKLVSYVPQASDRSLPPYTVFEYVLMGRFPYQGFMAIPSDTDTTIVDESLELTDTGHLRDRRMNELSGGEVQRVFLAGAVAQRTPVLLLDEPTTFLDPLHQELLGRALSRIHDEFGSSIVMVTHDINRAMHDCSHVIAIVEGASRFAGSVEDFSKHCPSILYEIFAVDFEEAYAVDEKRKFLVPCALK
jgi:ABC-type cobalamin/Fe3+-siderophores transport system ATPase subunit